LYFVSVPSCCCDMRKTVLCGALGSTRAPSAPPSPRPTPVGPFCSTTGLSRPTTRTSSDCWLKGPINHTAACKAIVLGSNSASPGSTYRSNFPQLDAAVSGLHSPGSRWICAANNAGQIKNAELTCHVARLPGKSATDLPPSRNGLGTQLMGAVKVACQADSQAVKAVGDLDGTTRRRREYSTSERQPGAVFRSVLQCLHCIAMFVGARSRAGTSTVSCSRALRGRNISGHQQLESPRPSIDLYDSVSGA